MNDTYIEYWKMEIMHFQVCVWLQVKPAQGQYSFRIRSLKRQIIVLNNWRLGITSGTMLRTVETKQILPRKNPYVKLTQADWFPIICGFARVFCFSPHYIESNFYNNNRKLDEPTTDEMRMRGKNKTKQSKAKKNIYTHTMRRCTINQYASHSLR